MEMEWFGGGWWGRGYVGWRTKTRTIDVWCELLCPVVPRTSLPTTTSE